MGEYLTLERNGRVEQVCKLGTCDHMMYVRRAEMEAWENLDRGQSTDIPALLKDSSTLYRFPWPDEDGEPDPEQVGKREPSRSVQIPVDLNQLKFDHHDKYIPIGPTMGGYNVNLFLPCPMTWTPGQFRNSGPPTPLITIFGERYDEKGRPRTVFRCGWCEAPFAVGETELAEIRQAVLAYVRDPEDARHKWFQMVAVRLRAKPED